MSPVIQPRTLGTVAGAQSPPSAGGHILKPVRDGLEPQPLPAGHRQDVTTATFLDTAAQRVISPIHTVTGPPPARHSRRKGAGQHLPPQLRLGREDSVL